MAKDKRKFVPTEEGQEKKAEQPARDKKLAIICPLTLAATTKFNKKPLAVNYTCVPETSIEPMDENGEWVGSPGVWYSSPKGRGHEPAFMRELDRRKALDESDLEHIATDEEGYYFTQEEGEAAREKYEEMVLAGETTIQTSDGEETIPVKGNAKSWRNKHAEFTGVSWEELMDMHPDLYKTSTTKKTTSKEESTETVEDEGEIEDLVSESEIDEDLDMTAEEVDALDEEIEDHDDDQEEEIVEDELEEIESA